MKKYFSKKLNKGFSLMETMIWVSIVGIFVGLITVSSVVLIAKAKVKAAKQEMNTYSAALLEYYETEGTFPTEDQSLQVLIDKNYIISKGKTKISDPWGTAYVYTLTNNGEGFIIKSLGSDKKEGGDSSTAKDIIVTSGDIGENNNAQSNETIE